MGARSEVAVIDAPYPVVFDAFVNALPTRGFRLTLVDARAGRIEMQTRNSRFTLALGAIDAITTEWVVTGELRLGMFRDRHDQHFAAIDDALNQYLSRYYPVYGDYSY